jgi:hypothetical protein
LNPASWDSCVLTSCCASPSLPGYSNGGVLFNKSQTILIEYPNGRPGPSYTIPNTVTNIGAGAFDSCTFTNITIPGSVTRIEASAFYDSTLNSITIPRSVTFLGDSAFGNVVISNGIYLEGNAPSLGGQPYYIFFGGSATVYYLPGTTG